MSTLSRRTLLRAGLLSAATCALHSRLEAAAQLPLISKSIPRSGEKLPVIGLGTIWYRDANYATLKQVIQRLFELGGSLIDTAAIYGESESVIGRALQELDLRRRCFLASKFDAGHMPATLPTETQLRGPGPGGVDGPPPGVIRPMPDGIGGRASFERSLQRLRTDHLDLLQVHTMSDAEALLPQMLEWKLAGKLRYVGVSAPAANPQRLAQVLKAFPLDFVQLDYSLSNRAAENGALQACAGHGAAVLINLPLGRNGMLRQVQGHALPDWVQEIDVTSWAQLFLKWVVSHPAVTCAIPGTTSVAHLEEDFRAGRGRLASAAQRLHIEQDWAAVA
ncbi:MAG: aldo/keto reductase [Steroidobacteraceae bacterium]|jgi:aryl-alcohol dehydrogenase-like predicted oxidoreductase